MTANHGHPPPAGLDLMAMLIFATMVTANPERVALSPWHKTMFLAGRRLTFDSKHDDAKCFSGQRNYSIQMQETTLWFSQSHSLHIDSSIFDFTGLWLRYLKWTFTRARLYLKQNDFEVASGSSTAGKASYSGTMSSKPISRRSNHMGRVWFLFPVTASIFT